MIYVLSRYIKATDVAASKQGKMAAQVSPVLRRKTTTGSRPGAAVNKSSGRTSTHSLMSGAAGNSQSQLMSAGGSTARGGGGTFMPSFYSIMTSKRLAKQFVSRFRRTGRIFAGSQSDRSSRMGQANVKKEPTYRMEPRSKFNTAAVETVMKEIIDHKLNGMQYDPVICPAMSKALTDEIKDKVKKLRFDRYKIVCMVTMGQKKGQGLRVSSRCTWDTACDNSCTYSWQEGDLFCSATVYGIYHE